MKLIIGWILTNNVNARRRETVAHDDSQSLKAALHATKELLAQA